MSFHQDSGKSASIAIALSVLLAACAPEGAPEQGAATPEEMFIEQCGACHGTEARAPTISELRALSSEDLRAAISDHATAGEIAERLPAARVDDLINYIEQE